MLRKMREKNKFNKLFLASILVILIIMLTSYLYFKEQEEKPGYKINLSEEEKGIVIILNKTEDGGVVIVLDTDKEVNVSEELEEKEEEQEEKAEEKMPTRVSEVDFYFLLKGKSYFRHILKENQVRTYNMSGYLVTIEPIIITSDRVKFRINNYTTKALKEDDSDSTQDFEIIVSNIYYRR